MAGSEREEAIVELWRYPIKSCAGERVERVRVCARGVEWDREWMVVDAENGRFRTQRTDPLMALAEVHVDEAARVLQVSTRESCECGAQRVSVRLDVPAEEWAARRRMPVKVWKHHTQGVDEGEEAAALFTALLGKPCRLVRRDAEGEAREMETGDKEEIFSWADAENISPSTELAFVDGHPLLLASFASLAELNRLLTERGKSEVPMSRFRPNIVVQGGSAFEEDGWGAVEARTEGSPSVCLVGAGRKGRCKLTTVRPDTGTFAPKTLDDGTTPHPQYNEPLDTLRAHRSPALLGVASKSPAPYFGASLAVSLPPATSLKAVTAPDLYLTQGTLLRVRETRPEVTTGPATSS